MLKVTIIKNLLKQYYIDCNQVKHHKYKHVADKYDIPRQKAYTAYELGMKITHQGVKENNYLKNVYNGRIN